ncbi:MAG: TrmH family RNA methyltransferase [Christensenellales bacterium]|jgi:TrmH family RNA methyltransferase|nr:RNA methyltransferase [Clostridiales bacterium]
MTIISSQNAKLKKIKALRSKKGRDKYGAYIVEGVNILKDLSPKDAKIIELYLKQSQYQKLKFLEESLGVQAYIVADALFDAVSDTKTPSGALAVAQITESKEISGNTLIMLCGISDAGNMGTILRTAAARGVKTALIYGDCVDIYSPKVIRAAMGASFYVNAVKIDYKEIDNLLRSYDLLGLDACGKSIYDYERNNKKIIIAVGSEAHGLPQSVKERCAEILSLPMEGKIESLNAAVSISIALYML